MRSQVDSVATTLSLAEQNHAEELKRVCLDYVSRNLQAVMLSEGYHHMVTSCPQLQARAGPLPDPPSSACHSPLPAAFDSAIAQVSCSDGYASSGKFSALEESCLQTREGVTGLQATHDLFSKAYCRGRRIYDC
jgi:hypothetical protein